MQQIAIFLLQHFCLSSLVVDYCSEVVGDLVGVVLHLCHDLHLLLTQLATS